MQSGEAASLLERADSIKTSNHAEFAQILESLDRNSPSLQPAQREYLNYLRGWQDAYVGNYESALTRLKSFVAATQDATLRFRAQATMVNVLSIGRRYEEAFEELNHLLESLDAVADPSAREQGLTVAALLYDEVGQYDLSLIYIDKVIKENWNGRGVCRGSQLKVKVLYESTQERARPAALEQEMQEGIDACESTGEKTYANAIRGYQARVYMEQGALNKALELLKEHYDEVVTSQYPRVKSQYDVLLAQTYLRLGDVKLARDYGLRAVESAVKNEYTEPLVAAYHLLYSVEKQRGSQQSALEFYEKYTAADKGYLDDISARQLAYERVRHEVAANKLQIESLQLQSKLDSKAIENVRLYIALLLVILGFIVFWAYKTKRSQLHFMNLSRRDGLTGIFNRPHFMESAASTLDHCRKLKQDVSLILCDLDHFKDINDRYGHAEGDAALKRMVEACLAHLRAADVFARVGGEEFCVLLPACGVEDARQRAEQLRVAIGAVGEKSRAAISASMGVSATTTSGYDLNQLMAHADLALYQAKRAGRNCVVIHDVNSVITPIRPGAASAST
ncbi:MAG TPA: GGDEF domain-containing protein [Steroidobacteraceae bacterium]|nr:GGDEF domain-containing protein [Steroidobacteraceae bacterium]